MNIHTKKEKEFVAKMLRLLRERGIEFSKQDRKKMLSSVTPGLPLGGKWEGNTIGRVGKELRLLWLLSAAIREASMICPDDAEDDVFRTAWQETHHLAKILHLASFEIHCLCDDAFWLLVKERFGDKVNRETHFFALTPDWRLCAVNLEQGRGPDRLNDLLSRIEDQLTVVNLCVHCTTG